MNSNSDGFINAERISNGSFSHQNSFVVHQTNFASPMYKTLSLQKAISSFYSSFKKERNNSISNNVLFYDDVINLLVKTIQIHAQLLDSRSEYEYEKILKIYINDLNNRLTSANNEISSSTYSKDYCIKITNEDIISKINKKIKEKKASITTENSLRNSYEFITNDYFMNYRKRAQSQINSPNIRLSKIKMNKLSNTIRKSKENSANQSIVNENSFDSKQNLTFSNRNNNIQSQQHHHYNNKSNSNSNRNTKFLYNSIKPSLYTTFLVQKGRKIVREYNKIGKSKEKDFTRKNSSII